MAVTRQ
jgi:hypothetical protein